MSALQTSTTSPLFKARMGGFCWLMCFLTSIYPLMLVGRFMVKGDPAATAANLLAIKGVNVQRWNEQARS